MSVGIVGSRGITDRRILQAWFDEAWSANCNLITGGAPGVDLLAEAIALERGDHPTVLRPDYRTYPVAKYGKDYAAKQRNKDIVDRSDRIVAFWDGRSTGTAFTIAWAVYRGKPVSVRLLP